MPNIAPMNMLNTLMPMLQQQGQQQGQQQAPDPTQMVNQVIAQFRQHLEEQKRAGKLTAPLALGGGTGAKPVQQPVGTSPYEAAGRMRSARAEGVENFMGQAAEQAGEAWKPQALDIGLMAATIALPIIAAMQPEGRGRRGLRKQQRMSGMFKTLGGFAGQGLGMRMESFGAGKEAAYGAAESRAERLGEESQAQYEHEIGGIEAAEGKRRWEAGYGLAERGMAVQERPKPGKPTNFDRMTPEQQKAYLNKQAYGAPSTAGRLTEQQKQTNKQKDILNRANMYLYSLDPKMRERAGILTTSQGAKYDITTFAALVEAAQALANYKEPTGLFGWGAGEAAPDSVLYDLMTEYVGDQTGLGQGLPQGGGQPGLDEIEAELARRQIGAGR